MDSGIKLRHVFCSITVAKIAEQFVIEPNSLELSSAESIFTFVFKPSLTTGGTLIASDSAGQFSLDKLVSASELAEKEALGIFDFYRTQIYQKFGHSLKTAWISTVCLDFISTICWFVIFESSQINFTHVWLKSINKAYYHKLLILNYWLCKCN